MNSEDQEMRKGIRPKSKAAAAQASRKLILDAAESLFAKYGFERTSLQQICDVAGVARGTPGYYFGSKEGLYRAVLERAFVPAQDLIASLREIHQGPGEMPEANLERIIGHVFDFFVSHPTFVRMTEWEGLNHSSHLSELPVLVTVLHDALEVLRQSLGRQEDAQQFLIDLVALCWFPVAHAQTFLAPLGLDAQASTFQAVRKAHVIRTLLHYREVS